MCDVMFAFACIESPNTINLLFIFKINLEQTESVNMLSKITTSCYRGGKKRTEFL